MAGKNEKRVQQSLDYALAALHFPENLGSDDVERMTSAVQAVARAQGALYVAELVDEIQADAQEQGQDRNLMEARIGHALLRVVSAGPDDLWSGRGNDTRRARFEGICEEAKRHIAYF
jgi:hypothetical protein